MQTWNICIPYYFYLRLYYYLIHCPANSSILFSSDSKLWSLHLLNLRCKVSCIDLLYFTHFRINFWITFHLSLGGCKLETSCWISYPLKEWKSFLLDMCNFKIWIISKYPLLCLLCEPYFSFLHRISGIYFLWTCLWNLILNNIKHQFPNYFESLYLQFLISSISIFSLDFWWCFILNKNIPFKDCWRKTAFVW